MRWLAGGLLCDRSPARHRGPVTDLRGRSPAGCQRAGCRSCLAVAGNGGVAAEVRFGRKSGDGRDDPDRHEPSAEEWLSEFRPVRPDNLTAADRDAGPDERSRADGRAEPDGRARPDTRFPGRGFQGRERGWPDRAPGAPPPAEPDTAAWLAQPDPRPRRGELPAHAPADPGLRPDPRQHAGSGRAPAPVRALVPGRPPIPVSLRGLIPSPLPALVSVTGAARPILASSALRTIALRTIVLRTIVLRTCVLRTIVLRTCVLRSSSDPPIGGGIPMSGDIAIGRGTPTSGDQVGPYQYPDDRGQVGSLPPAASMGRLGSARTRTTAAVPRGRGIQISAGNHCRCRSRASTGGLSRCRRRVIAGSLSRCR